jgi:hypothetical protein
MVAGLAQDQGVCVRPLARRLVDRVTGEASTVVLPCGSTQESRCPTCAKRARVLRMHQCAEGGKLMLGGSTQYAGAWGDNGQGREDRALKHRSSRSVRPVPACPQLVRILRHHLDTYTCGPDGRLFVTRTGTQRHPVSGGYAGPVSGSSYGNTWRKARAAALTTAEVASPLGSPSLRPAARLRVPMAQRWRACHPGRRVGRAQRRRPAQGLRQVHRRAGGQRPAARGCSSELVHE